MFNCVSSVLSVIFVLGYFTSECKAKHGLDRDRYQKGSVSCYECSSEYDPRCGDPFDPYTIGTVNCSLKIHPNHIDPSLPPSLCRKLVQRIQGEVRVIRGCGYITDPRDDKQCIRRTGTHEVIVHYCSCTTSYCNIGHQLHENPSFRIITMTVVIPAVISLLILA